MKRKLLLAVLICSLPGFASGCAVFKKNQASGVGCVVVSLKQMNTSLDNQPHPAKVRLYIMNDDENFRRADVHALWQRESEILSPNIIERKEITVFPERRVWLVFENVPEDAVFFGVVADYIRPYENRTKSIYRLSRDSKFVLGLMENHIVLKPDYRERS